MFLQSFVAVVDGGSIAEAARRLHVTPSALAQRLSSLELELGHPLVTRAGRTVRATSAGLAILPHARRLVREAGDLRAIADQDQPVGQIRVGATATSLTGLLPDILRRLRERFPLITTFVRPGSSSDLYRELAEGALDAALTVEPPFELPKSTGWLTLREEPFILIAAEEYGEHSVDHLLKSQPFIRYDRQQWGGDIVDRYLRKHAPHVREWLELDALDGIATLVNKGLGVSIVPDWPSPWPEGMRLQRKSVPNVGTRRTGVIWNRSGLRMAAINAFVECCSASVEQGHAVSGHPEPSRPGK